MHKLVDQQPITPILQAWAQNLAEPQTSTTFTLTGTEIQQWFNEPCIVYSWLKAHRKFKEDAEKWVPHGMLQDKQSTSKNEMGHRPAISYEPIKAS